MPFDNSTYETQPDVFSLAGLIAWLREQDPETPYSWYGSPSDCDGGCLIHQYLAARGWDPVQDYGKFAECAGPCRVADANVAMPNPHTFGAALQRALALAGE